MKDFLKLIAFRTGRNTYSRNIRVIFPIVFWTLILIATYDLYFLWTYIL